MCCNDKMPLKRHFIDFARFTCKTYGFAAGESCKECLLRKRPAHPAKPGDTITNEVELRFPLVAPPKKIALNQMYCVL